MNINSLSDVGLEEFHKLPYVAVLSWGDPDLKEIVRIRYLGDVGFPYWELSYCYGRDQKGNKVRITGLPSQFDIRKGSLTQQLVAAAREEKVYLKGLCGGHISDVLSLLS